MSRKLLSYLVCLLFTAAAWGQDAGYPERARQYVQQYASLAIAEQKRAGVPASVTLGQGILETEAGASELMTQANNHFGIKCKNGWQGETFSHDDDAPGECFKKYKCAEDSYKDHSDHLRRNPRYSPLFSIPQTNYSAWATGLKKCGYATSPTYAQQLIKIIEDYGLQEYTYKAMNDNKAVAEFASYHEPAAPAIDTPKRAPIADTTPAERPSGISELQHIADSARKVVAARPAVEEKHEPAEEPELNSDSLLSASKVVTVNGLKAVYVYKGSMLLPYAVKYNIRYSKLLEMNDLPDAPLAFSTCIYLEKKKGIGSHTDHTVKQGENMLMISQQEGIQLRRLMALNMIAAEEEPLPGDVLLLQTQATHKPAVKGGAAPRAAHTAMTNDGSNAGSDGDLVTTRTKTRPGAAAKTEPPAKPKPPVKPVITKTETTETRTETATTQEAPPQEDLSTLKAELDKVVYADDSKLIADNKAAAPQATPAPAVVAANKGAKFYTVKHGDTAFSIAKKNNITVTQLSRWNDLDDGGVKVGQTLRVKE
jgi:LysM repeat protein